MESIHGPILSKEKTEKFNDWILPNLIEKIEEEKRNAEEIAQKQQEKEILQLKEQAYHDGRSQGEKEGLALGKETIDSEIELLTILRKELTKPIASLTDDVFQLIKKIVISVTEAVVMCEIKTDPTIIENTLRQILDELGSECNLIHVKCSKRDSEIIQKYLSQHIDKEVKLEVDANISNGSFIVDTNDSHADATINGKINEIINKNFENFLNKDNQA